ncbi:MAG: hypothetical protein J0M35_12285 [Candidatus Obscuribacter phosphatis]|uniref:Uncharacterized protein n=1 Tax=Candidatus Obscuribacter phosphatis TaxID=1906157 RepID=A0A8J7PDF6_9BACT|nr:hypothetical protein [Candidatus Obscuribacter phosphatis]
MTDQDKIEAAIAEAFTLYVENKLSAYSWGWSKLEALCEEAPLNAYSCILKITESPSKLVASAVGAGPLKRLLEGSAALVMPALEQDIVDKDGLRTALASATAFGLYTGDLVLDEKLREIHDKFELTEHYKDLCKLNSFDGENLTQSFQFQDASLLFQVCKASNSNNLYFEVSNQGGSDADKIRICGELNPEEIRKWLNDLEAIYCKLQGNCEIKLGNSTCAIFTLSVSSLGSLAVQGNFWIKSFLMPHSIELEIDQTYLKTLIERLKEALKRVTSEGVT